MKVFLVNVFSKYSLGLNGIGGRCRKIAKSTKGILCLETFTEVLTILKYNTNASYHTANIKAALEKQRAPIGA